MFSERNVKSNGERPFSPLSSPLARRSVSSLSCVCAHLTLEAQSDIPPPSSPFVARDLDSVNKEGWEWDEAWIILPPLFF